MDDKRLLVSLVISIFLSGCAFTQEKPTKDDSGNVRVSGDITVSTIDRKGF